MSTIRESLLRVKPDVKVYYFGQRRSVLRTSFEWSGSAYLDEDVLDLAAEVEGTIGDGEDLETAVFIENINDFQGGPADRALLSMVKSLKRAEQFIVADADIAAWGPTVGLIAEVKNSRVGLVLQPDSADASYLLKTPLPRSKASDFPPGRGFFVARGTATRVQVAHTAGKQGVG